MRGPARLHVRPSTCPSWRKAWFEDRLVDLQRYALPLGLWLLALRFIFSDDTNMLPLRVSCLPRLSLPFKKAFTMYSSCCLGIVSCSSPHSSGLRIRGPPSAALQIWSLSSAESTALSCHNHSIWMVEELHSTQ